MSCGEPSGVDWLLNPGSRERFLALREPATATLASAVLVGRAHRELLDDIQAGDRM